MDDSNSSLNDFLAHNEERFEHIREVCLHEFEKGSAGWLLIIEELMAAETLASAAGLEVLTACLREISSLLQGWITVPVPIELSPTLLTSWSDLVCELSNTFMFLGQDDDNNLRERFRYRIIQLVKASAVSAPAAPVPIDDGSWGLFDDSVPAPAAASQPTVAFPSPTRSANQLASHYLICLLGSQHYALPIHQVREILGQRHEKALPAEKIGIRGLVTVRGLVCPVVDVSQILHAKEDEAMERDLKKRCLVICEVDRRTFCFTVDDVKQVAALDEFDDPITPLHPEHSIQKAISHVAHFQNKSVLFVKMQEVIPV